MLRWRQMLRAWKRYQAWDTEESGTRGARGCAKSRIVNQTCNWRDKRLSLKRLDQDIRVNPQGMSRQVARHASRSDLRLPGIVRFGVQGPCLGCACDLRTGCGLTRIILSIPKALLLTAYCIFLYVSFAPVDCVTWKRETSWMIWQQTYAGVSHLWSLGKRDFLNYRDICNR